MSSTYTDKNNPFLIVSRNKHSQLETFSQPCLQQDLLKLPFLPKDDLIDSVQEEQLGLRYWTTILAICVVVDESKNLDIPTLDFSITSAYLPF